MSGLINAHGPGVTVIDDASQLPAVNAHTPGDIVVSRNGLSWFLDKLPLAWVPFGAGSAVDGADIVFVVGRPAKYPPTLLSSAVYPTLEAAVAALAALSTPGASIMLLDDTYTITAPLTLPNNTRLFSFSRNGVVITSALGTGTLETEDSAEFENVTITNSAAGPSIRTTGAFTRLGFHGASVLTPINLRNDGGAVVIDTASTIHSVVGGTAPNQVTVRDSSVTVGISLPNVGSTLAAKSSSIATVETLGAVTFEQGSVGVVGAIGQPSSFTATGTLMTGLVRAGQITVDGCVSSAGLQSVSTDIVCRNSTVGLIDSVRNVTMTDGTCASINAPNPASSVSLMRATVSGSVIAAGNVEDIGSTFLGNVAFGAISRFKGSTSTGQLLAGVGIGVQVTNCIVNPPVTPVGEGAIVMNGGACVVADSFVRSGDQALSVTGSGTLVVQGSMTGGGRITGVTTPNSVSGMTGNRVVAGIAPIGATPMQTVLGTTEVVDTAVITPAAAGAVVILDPLENFPMGFKQTITNESAADAFDIDGNDAETIDGSVSRLIGIREVVTIQKISATNWRIISRS